MPLEPGALLYTRYRIERVLGQGGMGAVYLATDETLGLHVAVKENLNPNPEAEKQFRREATLLASLRHHNLPRVTNHFILGQQQYLVMDFVEGEDLKERLARQGPLPEVDVLLWAAQICDALSYLHRLDPPVIHRDIKPANIKINPADEVRLVDFGIAKAAAAGQKTTTGAVALTPGFAPPEQYGMGRTDPRTDQYALAATFYNLLTGKLPPDSMDRLLGNVRLTPPKELRPDLSDEVNAALLRALELKPDERFENVEAFKLALFGKAPAAARTVLTPTAQPTVAQSQASTQVAAPPTVAHPAETVVASSAASAPTAARTGWPGWVLPAGIGGAAVLVIGAIFFGMAGFAGFSALRPTETQAPTATPTAQVQVVVVTATSPPSTATPTPAPPTQTPTPEPSPTPTATPTPAPPTQTPTAAGPPLGGGGRLAFVSNRDGRHFQIYTMNPDGSDVRQLTFDERDKWSPNWRLGNLGPLTGTQLTWSPDGAQLLYVAEGAPGSGLDLWVINADGTNPVNLTAPIRAGQIAGDDFQPAWCPEGWIAFTSTRVNNIPQVFLMHLDDRTQRNFSATRASPIEYSPVWFPDCRRMLLITTQNGIAELWRVFPFPQTFSTLWATFPPSSQTSYRVFLSDQAGYNAAVADPAISPDGQFVIYTRQAPSGNDIIQTTVSDSQLTMRIQQLTDTRNNSSPQWSPDGRYIVFVSRRDEGTPQVYRMNFVGGEQTNLSRNAFTELNPVWQPAP